MKGNIKLYVLIVFVALLMIAVLSYLSRSRFDDFQLRYPQPYNPYISTFQPFETFDQLDHSRMQVQKFKFMRERVTLGPNCLLHLNKDNFHKRLIHLNWDHFQKLRFMKNQILGAYQQLTQMPMILSWRFLNLIMKIQNLKDLLNLSNFKLSNHMLSHIRKQTWVVFPKYLLVLSQY